MNPFFDKVAIIGVGLLGGSVGLALKARGMCGKVVGVGRSQSSIEAGLRVGAIDEATEEVVDAAKGANLVVVSTPVGSVAGIIAELENSIESDCIITDVGSTKRSIVYEVEQLRRAGPRFVGSHPLAGSERKGVQHASASLFENAFVFVTLTPVTDRSAANEIREMWKQLGGKVVDLEPDAHDRIVARTSHSPHIVAALLVAGLRALPEEYSKLVGKGFLDTTRIASSDPEMWADICISNAEEIKEALATLRDDLDEFEMYLNEGEYEKFFDFFNSIKRLRDSLNQKDSNA
ncbi:prephenate dehydrogenase/arogenate dehydrogenase family protein [Candidatus Poribacteria bacterium]|nr:prephenate dehydrogenase/arogenate dehydrogenase family protein [Candidatus Poribacteria bacterium]